MLWRDWSSDVCSSDLTLVAVAKPTNHIEGEILRQKLIAVGIKATLTQTNEGPRIFVFPQEESAARAHLNDFS